MKRIIGSVFFLIIVLATITQVNETHASKNRLVTLQKEQSPYYVINSGHKLQLELIEGSYSASELKNKLSKFFTDKFIDDYILQNYIEYNGKLIFKATDFPYAFVPDFTFDKNTKKEITNNSRTQLVYQWFDAVQNEPVTHDGVFSYVKLIKDNDDIWKIDDIGNTLSKPILN
ncbi:MAG: hypothetical protein K0S51_1612 [Bacillales bacterium]|jgi:hypothetical protein|nr:hypothetical protein [Bacillales bacterium]